MTIKIRGYGLGLSQEGSDTLYATSLDEFEAVMKFGFKTMTQLEDNFNIGMVYGMEVVPWVHNTGFQTNARLVDQDILRVMPRNLIPKAKLIDKNDRTTQFDNNDNVIRAKFRCKNGSYLIDKFGFCCEPEELYDISKGKYRTESNETTIKTDICRPIQSIDVSLVKDNMSNNAEFVTRLSSAFRYKIVAMATLEKCISASNSIPDKYLDNLLQQNLAGEYLTQIDTPISVRHLKLAVDPQGDYSLLMHLGKELDEWIDMFYSPCLAAIYGLNVGSTPDVDPQYFMADAWYNHKECMYLTCLTNNMRWDRNSGGCVPGLVTLDSAANYTAGQDSQCSKDTEETDGAAEKCKYPEDKLTSYQSSSRTCWKELPIRNVAYFIETFCMPQVTKEVMADGDTKTQLKTRYDACRPQMNPAGRRLSHEMNIFNFFPSQSLQYIGDFEFVDDDEEYGEEYDFMYDELKNLKAPSEEEESDFFANLKDKIAAMRRDNEKQERLKEEARENKVEFAANLKKMIEDLRNAKDETE